MSRRFTKQPKVKKMAKKSPSSRKTTEESSIAVGEVTTDLHETSVPETRAAAAAAAADETPLSKPSKAKATEDQATTGSVGLGDIRKAVAFANSVGGLDKAIALLQIVKVAKEVQ